MSWAVFSCDLDTVDRHLQGYGFDGLPACDLVYRTAVPRVLELLEGLGVPGVLFTIARDAEAQRPLLRRAVASGHEVASHSLTHPQPFATLDDAALDRELRESRARLEAATGGSVLGFRAPAWDVDGRVFSHVRDAGYRYDASVFPTPVLVASRLAAWRRGMRTTGVLGMATLRHAIAQKRPHRLHPNGVTSRPALVEFPIAVTRWLRLPVYHTLSHLVPECLFQRNLHALLRSPLPVCYEFHAADLLDLAGDGVDPRMSRHPGMQVPLEDKQARLRDILATIAAARRVVTYRDVLHQEHLT